MNIWYVNHYASPPDCGRGERPLHIARALRRHGHEPLIVAASHHHLQFTQGETLVAKAAAAEVIPFHFVQTRPYSGNGGGRRLFGMLDFARGLRRLNKAVTSGQLAAPEVIIYSSPHPFGYPAAARLAKQFRAKIIMEERDLWPLSLVELAGVPRWHPVVLWLNHLVARAYQNCDAAVSLLPKTLAYLMRKGLPEEHFHYIPNGIVPGEWEAEAVALPEDHQRVFTRCREQKRLVIIYAGALGKPNALAKIFALEAELKNSPPYHFILIGAGDQQAVLRERAAQSRYHFVSVLPPVPKTQLRSALAQADVGYIGLQDSPLFQYGVSPNKLFDYFMAGKPVINAIRAGNDPVAAAEAGISIDPNSPVALANALAEFAKMSAAERAVLGARGRKYVLANHNWESLGDQYAQLCEELVNE